MLKFGVVTFAGFHLAGLREVADAFHVADDACEVVEMFAAALRALLEVTLVDMSAVVTHRIRDVEILQL